MPVGLEKTVLNLFEALVNETALKIEWQNDNTIQAIIPNITDSTKQHRIIAQCQKSPFCNELEQFQWSSLLLDEHPIKTLDDLNQLATDYLEEIYELCRTRRPKLFESISKLTGISLPLTFDGNSPQAYALLLSSLPAREALIISETCGNIDGSTGNPIKNVIFGPKPNAIQYHPISVAFKSGTSKIELVSYPGKEIIELGSIPSRLSSDFKYYLDDHLIPMNHYSVDVSNKQSDVQGSIDAFVLLSKRSFMPFNGDYQIKTSFPAQITSENRLIDWKTAEDAIECAHIVLQLANLHKLPDNLWVLPTLFAAQVKDDDNTTFYIRGGLRDAYENGSHIGVPEHLTPVTACALTTRNILTPNKTLFESLVEFGFDPIKLFEDISDGIIGAQLHFIGIRWVPDAHTQNVAYLFDLKKKQFAGLLLKDAECEKNKIIRGGKLASTIFDWKPILQTESETNTRIIVSTLYFHHTIYTKHIEPIARLLHQKYHVSIDHIQKIVHHSLTSWIKNNPQMEIQHKIDLSGRYYERNLACKTLKIGQPPHYRLIENHKLLPALQDQISRK